MASGERPSPEEIVLYEKDPETKIATITFNRPDHLNAPTSAARLRYADLLHEANIDDDVKVLVIRGVGDDLGSGADLPEFMEGDDDADRPAARASGSRTTDVTYPPEGIVPPRRDDQRQWYANVRGGQPRAAGVQEDQHRRGQGLLLRLALLPSADADLVISSDDALFGHPAFRYVGWGPRMWRGC